MLGRQFRFQPPSSSGIPPRAILIAPLLLLVLGLLVLGIVGLTEYFYMEQTRADATWIATGSSTPKRRKTPGSFSRAAAKCPRQKGTAVAGREKYRHREEWLFD